MIKVLNSNLKMIGVLNNIHECTEHQVLNSEYTLDFSCTAEKLKTELLYDKTNIIECDDNYYRVFSFDELHEMGGLVTFSCSAEHIGYEIIQKIFEDGFEMTGTVQQIGQAACSGTRFTFASDIEGIYTVKLTGVTNARAVVDRLCILTGGEVKWDKFSIKLKQSIGQNTIYVEFGKNCSSIKRHVQYEPDKVSYTVDLIDCNDEETKELRKVHLGDMIIINDKVLHTENVSKKVISLDIDKLANSASSITDQTVENFDKTIPSSTVCVLGDKETTIIDEILKNVEIPDLDPNILIEVVEQKVITSEVAMIQNCWINELSVNYLETNFSALDTRQPYVGVRDFIRVYNEVFEHITQELSQTEVEDYKTPSGLQIYWTAINDAPQAYKYFTITHPREYNPDLTNEQAEAFKVKARKVVKEYVKLSTNFETFKEENDVVPTMIFGSGHGDSSGVPISAPSECQIINGRSIYRGQGMIYKSRKGLHINYINANGKKYEIIVGENGIELGKCIFTEDDETLLTNNKKITGAINEVFLSATDAFNTFKNSIISKGGTVAEPVNKTNINNGILSLGASKPVVEFRRLPIYRSQLEEVGVKSGDMIYVLDGEIKPTVSMASYSDILVPYNRTPYIYHKLLEVREATLDEVYSVFGKTTRRFTGEFTACIDYFGTFVEEIFGPLVAVQNDTQYWKAYGTGNYLFSIGGYKSQSKVISSYRKRSTISDNYVGSGYEWGVRYGTPEVDGGWEWNYAQIITEDVVLLLGNIMNLFKYKYDWDWYCGKQPYSETLGNNTYYSQPTEITYREGKYIYGRNYRTSYVYVVEEKEYAVAIDTNILVVVS